MGTPYKGISRWLRRSDEIPQYYGKSTTDVAARRGVARTGARRRTVYARGNCAAFAGGTGRISRLAVYRGVLPCGAAVCGRGAARRSVVADRKRVHQFSREAGVAHAGFARAGAVSWADAGV